MRCWRALHLGAQACVLPLGCMHAPATAQAACVAARTLERHCCRCQMALAPVPGRQQTVQRALGASARCDAANGCSSPKSALVDDLPALFGKGQVTEWQHQSCGSTNHAAALNPGSLTEKMSKRLRAMQPVGNLAPCVGLAGRPIVSQQRSPQCQAEPDSTSLA